MCPIIHILLNLAAKESAYGFTRDLLEESAHIQKAVGPVFCKLGLFSSERISLMGQPSAPSVKVSQHDSCVPQQ